MARRGFTWTEKQLDKLNKVIEVLDELNDYKPLTLRQIYYQLVSLCALLKGQTVPEFVREYFADYLTYDMGGERCGIILAEKIKLLLKEKGPLTEEELVAELPERVCRDLDLDDFMRSWLYHAVQKTDDGNYELKKEQL